MKTMQEKIAARAQEALRAQGFETEPGMCWRWVREVLEDVGVPADQIPPRGYDAEQCFEWYKAKGMTQPGLKNSMPGSVMFFVGVGHGKHGHVGIRVPGNLMAENSSVHVGPGDRDARGTRAIVNLHAVSGTVTFK